MNRNHAITQNTAVLGKKEYARMCGLASFRVTRRIHGGPELLWHDADCIWRSDDRVAASASVERYTVEHTGRQGREKTGQS